MKKSKGELTQERILEIAAEVFMRDGFAASRTIDIAEKSEVSEATLFKYFKSKQGLLDAVTGVFVDHVSKKVIIDPLDEIFEKYKDDSPKVMLREMFLNRLDLAHQFKKYAVVTITESRFNHQIRETIVQHIFPEVQVFGEKIVSHYKARGVFRSDIDSWILLRSAMMAVVGMIFTNEIIGIDRGISLEEELDSVIDFVLRGALSEEGRSALRGGVENE